jgi:hypothetical protein
MVIFVYQVAECQWVTAAIGFVSLKSFAFETMDGNVLQLLRHDGFRFYILKRWDISTPFDQA